MEKSRLRMAVICSLLSVFLVIIVLPTINQSQLPFQSAAFSGTPNYDPIAVKNPCDWWWGCQTNNFDSYILRWSSYWNLPDPMVIKAMIALESGFNTQAEAWNSWCYSYDEGLMQVNPTCNNLNAVKLLTAGYNVNHGSHIWVNNYNYLVNKWGSSCSLKNLVMGALEMYNLGSGGAGSYCGSFPKGTQYASNVLNDYYYPFCQDSGYKPRF